MTNERGWPEAEEPRPEVPTTPLGRRGRFLRALGDAFLTAGLSKGMQGDSTAGGSNRAATNAMLFGEAERKGREANEGATGDRD
jgi:hypothetical protein